MASRLAFDIGLHINLNDTSETERRVRRQVMAACLMLDRHLAAFLGRPTSIKSQDVGVNLAPKDLSILSMESAMFGLPEFDRKPNLLTDAAIHPHMMELIELATSIMDSQNMCQNPIDAVGGEGSRYMQTVAMDRQLQNWYRRLPGFLAWSPLNAKAAPLSFFLLHQSFHVYMILLHRPWARYGPVMDDGFHPTGAFAASVAAFSQHFGSSQPGIDDSRATMARNMCTQHAVRVARIFWQHRQRFDGKKIGLVAAHHAGTAALALMGALAHQNKELDHQSNLRYLQVLSSAIYDMSQTYHPAARMYHLLKSMLVDIRKEMVSSRNTESDAMFRFQQGVSGMAFQPSYAWANNAPTMYPALPVTHESSETPTAQPAKKRRLSERRPSEIDAQVPLPFPMGNGFDYPSPPTSSKSLGDSSADKPEATSPGVSAPEDHTSEFDFDFLNGSVVDFDETQGDTIEVAAAVTDIGCTASVNQGTQGTMEAQSGEVLPQKQAEQAPKLRHQEDENAADMTIEEWLSEPRVVTPAPQAKRESEKNDMTMEDLFGDKPTTDVVTAPRAMGSGISGDCDMQWLVDMDAPADGDQAEMSLSDLVESVVPKTEKRPVRNLDLDFLRL
jgi:hypothetical protein